MSATNQEMAQFPAPPPYGGSKDHRYSPIPQTDAYNPAPASHMPAGPVGYSAQPQPQYQPYPNQPQMMAGGYAPAPPVLNQQSSSNVVVVNQPSAMPSAIVVHSRPRAATYLTLTLVMMAICFIHGNVFAFICLIPALIFAIIATNRNDEGHYDEAKHFGKIALGCNIAMFVKYGVFFLVIIILIIVYFAVGFSAASSVINTDCTYYCNSYGDCNTVCY